MDSVSGYANLMSNDLETSKNHNGVEFVTLPWADAIALYDDQWASVIHQEGLNPSLLPAWINAIASSVGKIEDIHVLTGVRNNEFEAAIPYLLSKRRVWGIPTTHLELTSNLVSYHAEIVSESNPYDIVEKLLKSSVSWHIFHAANLRPNGATASALRTIADEIGGRLLVYPTDSSPFLPIKGDWESFLASKNKKFRYKYRQRRKLFEGNPDYSMRWFGKPVDIEILLNDILRIEARSWKAPSRIDISSNSSEKQYYEILLPFLAERGCLLANIFYDGNRPLAYNLCCSWNGWIGQLKTSFDEEFKHLSPGSIVIDAAIREAFLRKAYEFDFLGHADKHKLSWTKHTREHADFFIYGPAIRSRVLGYLKALKNRMY